eukprot:UN27106
MYWPWQTASRDSLFSTLTFIACNTLCRRSFFRFSRLFYQLFGI